MTPPLMTPVIIFSTALGPILMAAVICREGLRCTLLMQPVNLFTHSAKASLPLSGDAKISLLILASSSLSDKDSIASTNSSFSSTEKLVGPWSSHGSIFGAAGSAALNRDTVGTLYFVCKVTTTKGISAILL
uniref:Uncharacterized protein n=1 Tax=Glossina austeni TaxID=7395 RepID=A0A1A9UYJ9_GLOAU